MNLMGEAITPIAPFKYATDNKSILRSKMLKHMDTLFSLGKFTPKHIKS